MLANHPLLIAISHYPPKHHNTHPLRPRQIAMHLTRQMTKNSLMNVGKATGGRDHGTVTHACKKLTEMMTTDHNLKELVAKLSAKLQR